MVSSEADILRDSLSEFSELQTARAVYGSHCEEIAELVDPPSRNTFFYGSYNTPGQKKTDRQVDGNAGLALDRFAAILVSILTPPNQTWHTVSIDNDYLLKDRNVRLYYEKVTRLLFKARYNPKANFAGQNQIVFRNEGAYGTGSLFVDTYQGIDGKFGLRYKGLPLGETYLRENHQGMVDGYCRPFRLTARQALQQFADEKDRLPPQIHEAAQKGSQFPYNFLHRVCPREDYYPGRLDSKGMLYASYYLSLDYSTLLRESGYRTLPLAVGRYVQTPGETYGRGPMMQVLPAIKTLNSEKRDFLTQGHRAVSPVLLMGDDGIVGFSMRPGAENKGGWSEDGHPLIGTLPIGDINVSKEMMDEEKLLIEAAALTDLFKVLLGDPKIYTATQIVEMMSQRGILIAPAMGRQQSEYLGSVIPRELDLMDAQGMLPPKPPALLEAKGEYHIQYSSPLARDQRSSEVAGFTRIFDLGIQVANATGDPSHLDRFDFDTFFPDAAQIQGSPEKWMASDEMLAQKRQGRQQAAERAQQTQEAPAKAALMKASAAQAKAGNGGPILAPQPVAAPGA
jgi:hypothetical protein